MYIYVIKRGSPASPRIANVFILAVSCSGRQLVDT